MPLFNSTLLRIEIDGEAIRIQTHSRRHRARGYHLLYRIDLETFLNGTDETLLDRDSGSFLYCWKADAGVLHLRLSWVNSTCRDDDSFTGWHDYAEIPLSFVFDLLSAGNCTRRFLFINRRASALFDFTNSQHVIAAIIEDKRRKRAFSKGMRDSHAHHTGLFRMYPDFVKHSFYFEACKAGKGRTYSGGLILHAGQRDTPIGKQDAFEYRRHT